MKRVGVMRGLKTVGKGADGSRSVGGKVDKGRAIEMCSEDGTR
jgi:hypothetical protein